MVKIMAENVLLRWKSVKKMIVLTAQTTLPMMIHGRYLPPLSCALSITMPEASMVATSTHCTAE